MIKFTVSTDSTCDLYRQYVDENDVKFVSLTFTVEEKGTLTDGLDAFTTYQEYIDFYAKLRCGRLFRNVDAQSGKPLRAFF